VIGRTVVPILIIVVLGLLFWLIALRPRRERFVEREVTDKEQYRAQLQEAAKHERCPKCRRAPGRPCYPSYKKCGGRINPSTSWKG
jgi:hypothetical protein